MGTRAVWHGTEREAAELLEALQHHCACRTDARNARLATCAVHHMALTDQRALDGLAWMRRMVDRLRSEEFGSVRTDRDGSEPGDHERLDQDQ
jgi:hypothetical protein